jgi:hypothetical protein
MRKILKVIVYKNYIQPRYWEQLSVLLPEANGNKTLESQNPKNS